MLTCRICKSDHKADIDAAIIRGTKYREIKNLTGYQLREISYHKNQCLVTARRAAIGVQRAPAGKKICLIAMTVDHMPKPDAYASLPLIGALDPIPYDADSVCEISYEDFAPHPHNVAALAAQAAAIDLDEAIEPPIEPNPTA